MDHDLVCVEAHLPEYLIAKFLQHIRDFDTQHPGCHFQIVILSPQRSDEEVRTILASINPPFAFVPD